MAKNSMEYSDIFCQAVQNIVNGSVSNLNFDMSKECTITKIINKSYGRYEVYDGSISFEAVATEGSTYQVGDSVMVTIPQGDSNKQIIILNKIIDEWTGPAGFVRPLDTLVNCTGNIAFNNHKQQSLIANGSQSLINVLTLKRQKFFGFQRIGVSAKFRSLLNNLGVVKGDYGLMFTFIQKSNNKDISDSVKQYKFSCSDMLGNPYAFSTYFKQEYAFDIDSTITQINELYVDFYQDAQFKDGNDNLIASTEYANLFIKDLEIYFGYPQDKEISEVVEIYSDNFEYSGNGLGTKQVYLQWIHKTDDYHLEHITKEEYFKENSPYEVRWYQYTSGCDDSKTDEYGGKHWELLNKVRPSSSSENYPFEFVINVRPTYTEEKVKVVCLVRTHPLTNDPTYEQITRFDSNILIFQNLQEEAGENAPPQEILQKNLSLHFHDNSYGNYFLYDQNGRLIDGFNQGETYKRRLEIFYDGSPITENADWYNSIQAISWEVPAAPKQQNNSMIYYNEEGFVEPNKSLIDNDMWNKSQVLSENGNEKILEKSLSSLKLSVRKDTYKDVFLTTQIDNSVNGKFNLSIKEMLLNVLDIDESVSIPNNLTATIKLSLWIDSGKTWADSDGHYGDNWMLIGNHYHTISLKKSQTIKNLSDIFPINRDHKKIMIGIGLVFDDNNEDFLNFMEEIRPTFDLSMPWGTDSGEDNVKFSVQSEFYTKTTYSTKDSKGNTILNTYFDYSISSVWYKDRSNNTIRCRITIDDKDYLLQEELRFGTKGSNGTNNTLILEITDGKNALTAGKGQTLTIDAMLIKGDGKRVILDSAQITWELINNTFKNNSGVEKEYMVISSTDGSKATLEMKEEIDNKYLNSNYTILKASVKYNTGESINPVLESYLPIPIRSSPCVGMSGTKEVIYNSQGVPPYGNEIYIAYIDKGNNFIEEKYNYLTSQYERGWAIKQPQVIDENDNIINLNPNPAALEILNGRVALKVSPLYSKKGNNKDSIQDKICIYYIDDSGQIIWSQPILIMQSSYDFAMLNSWDGSLTINEENGTILSTMLGAGRKNDQNQFSGVLLGDVETGTGNTSISQTGVYGFQNGVMTYALKEDGTGFFGGSGNGRIEFDGINGTISSNGWEKGIEGTWTLSGKSTGTLLDLSNGKLIMQGGNDSYFKFNDDNKGTLQMSLSGLNIKLTDKDNDPNLSGYIDATAKGLITEFRRTASYSAISDSTGKIKELKNLNFTAGFSSNNAQQGLEIKQLTPHDIMKNGVTIAVTFTKAENVAQTEMAITDPNNKDADGNPIVTGKKIIYTGRDLYLGIYLSPEDNAPRGRPIYLNNKALNNTSSDQKTANYFGWAAGTTVYFTYMGDYETGHWEITDSGSYSKITQTADKILSEVSTIGGNLSSSITQTADSIRMEVAKKATYKCTCATVNGTKVKEISTKLTDSKGNEIKALSSGCIINVTFSEAETVGTNLWFEFKNNTNTQGEKLKYKIGGTVIWNKGETLPFIFDGSTWTVTSISNASIDIRDNRITSEVRRTAGYACNYPYNREPSVSGTIRTYTVDMLNTTLGLTSNDILQPGVTLAVTFNRARVKTDEKDPTITPIKLIVSFNGQTTNSKSIRLQGKTISKDNPFGWDANTIIYFAYNDSGYWDIVDSGAYSKITQTADNIRATVVSQKGSNKENSFSWDLTANGFKLLSNSKEVFICDAKGITVNGTINATSGTIGDFSISGNVLMTEDYIQVENGKVVKDATTGNPVYVTGDDYKDGVYIGPDCIKLGKYFQLNNNGYLYAKRGQIGGINIYGTHLGTKVATSEGLWNGTLAGDMTKNDDNKCMYIGTNGININNKFKVDSNGNVKAANGTFTGTVYAGEGSKIKDCSVTNTTIVCGSADSANYLEITKGGWIKTKGAQLGSLMVTSTYMTVDSAHAFHFDKNGIYYNGWYKFGWDEFSQFKYRLDNLDTRVKTLEKGE